MTDSQQTPGLPENTTQQFGDVARRLQLVNYYNFLLGAPSPAVAGIQRDFVMGAMTANEMASILRLYQLVVDGAAWSKRS
jgi:hypothetical protein